MSDLNTMKVRLLRDVHIDSTTSGSLAESDVKIAIIDAIRHNRRFHFWFNEGNGHILTENEKWKYDLPVDFIGMLSDPFFIDGDAASDFRNQLLRESWEWMNQHYNRAAEWETSVNLGSPRRYYIDLTEKQIWLLPVPNETGNQIIFRYLKDCGTPDYKCVSSTWNFYKPNSEDTLPDTFTNAWFKEGYNLTFFRAAFELWSGPYGGSQEASGQAQSYLIKWTEELNRLRGETQVRSAQHSVRRHI